MGQLFESKPLHRKRWITWTWLAALYLAGVCLWGHFFSWGQFPLGFHDWAHISGPRLTFLKDALVQGLPPLHISDPDPSDPYPLGGITDRFLAIPDQILSPQVILLRILPIEVFVAGNVLLLYSLGYAGLLWLKRKFSLSLVAFTILFLLFNFNGHILAHFAVGHATWGGYFLFPWFAILVFQLVEGERGWTWIAKMALLLFCHLSTRFFPPICMGIDLPCSAGSGKTGVLPDRWWRSIICRVAQPGAYPAAGEFAGTIQRPVQDRLSDAG